MINEKREISLAVEAICGPASSPPLTHPQFPSPALSHPHPPSPLFTHPQLPSPACSHPHLPSPILTSLHPPSPPLIHQPCHIILTCTDTHDNPNYCSPSGARYCVGYGEVQWMKSINVPCCIHPTNVFCARGHILLTHLLCDGEMDCYHM